MTNDAEAPARKHLSATGILDAFGVVIGYDSGFGAKPAPDPEVHRPARGKPKPVWTKKAQETAKSERKERDRSNKGSDAEYTPKRGKAPDGPSNRKAASQKRAADTSKRFVPPHKRGQKQAGGPNAKPRRK